MYAPYLCLKPLSYADVEQQVSDGLTAAYEANAVFDSKKPIGPSREQYERDIGMSELELALLWELAERAPEDNPFYAKYVKPAQTRDDEFEALNERAAEGIGRGSIGGLFFAVVTLSESQFGSTSDPQKEFNEGVAFAFRANAAFKFGKHALFTEFCVEADKRLGRTSDAGMQVDILRQVLRAEMAESDESYSEQFNRFVLIAAARSFAERDIANANVDDVLQVLGG